MQNTVMTTTYYFYFTWANKNSAGPFCCQQITF